MGPDELQTRMRLALCETGVPPAMRFDRFMERALYEPGLGYYTRPSAVIGRDGDFVTSPTLSAAFGRTLAALCRQVRAAVSGPGGFRIVDAGAGEGGLLLHLLGRLRDGGALAGIEAVLVERGEALRERAAARLRAAGLEVRALADVGELASLAPLPGVVLANELLDALPVRRFRRGPAGPEEAHVGAVGGDGLAEVWLPFADPGLELPALPRSERCVAPELGPVVRALGASLSRGLVLLVDYGWPACLIDGEDGGGNALRGFRGGTLVDDLAATPGEIDLTAHVDFSAVGRAAEAAGLATVFFTDQTYLLLGLGFLEDPDATRARRLIDPGDLGGVFRCLGLARGMDERDFRGLALRDRRALLSR